MHVGKKRPGSAPGHEWKKPDDVVEVDDTLGQELVAIPGGGFYEVLPGAEPEDAGEDEREVAEAPSAPKRRPRKTPSASETAAE